MFSDLFEKLISQKQILKIIIIIIKKILFIGEGRIRLQVTTMHLVMRLHTIITMGTCVGDTKIHQPPPDRINPLRIYHRTLH
jgi:hypothetical protein